MRPVNIVLLVLAGAIGGAVVMKVVQWPHPAQVAEVEARAPVAPVTAPVSEPAAEPPVASVVEPPAVPNVEPPAAPNVEPPAEPTTTVVPLRKKHRPGGLSHRRVPPRVPTVVAARMQTFETAAAKPLPLQTPPLTPEQPKETPPGHMEPQEATPVPAQIPVAPEPHTVTLNAGMLIPVRLVDGLSLERNHAGDHFAATLDNELDADGFVIAERGARVEGKVVTADAGATTLSIELTHVDTSDRQSVAIQTERFDKRNEPDRSGDVAAAMRKAVTLPSETRLTFRLRAPVTITERRD